MYVLDPWQRTTVQGWRTSLQEVRQFTFVDERALLRRALRQGQREDGLDRNRGLPRAARARALGPAAGAARSAPRPSSRRVPRPAGVRRRRTRLARDSAEAAAPTLSRRRAGPCLPGHRLGRAGARSRRARQLRPGERAERARDAALRVPARARRPRRPAPTRPAPRPPVGARPRRTGLRPAAAW